MQYITLLLFCKYFLHNFIYFLFLLKASLSSFLFSKHFLPIHFQRIHTQRAPNKDIQPGGSHFSNSHFHPSKHECTYLLHSIFCKPQHRIQLAQYRLCPAKPRFGIVTNTNRYHPLFYPADKAAYLGQTLPLIPKPPQDNTTNEHLPTQIKIFPCFLQNITFSFQCITPQYSFPKKCSSCKTHLYTLYLSIVRNKFAPSHRHKFIQLSPIPTFSTPKYVHRIHAHQSASNLSPFLLSRLLEIHLLFFNLFCKKYLQNNHFHVMI